MPPADATARLRAHALQIWAAALRAADPTLAVTRYLNEHPPRAEGRLIVVGAGKAAATMAAAAEEVLGDRIDGGVVVTKDGHGRPLPHIEVLEASHPVPDARSVQAGERLLAEVAGLTADDRVLGLWSGGGSSLLEAPASGWTLTRIQEQTEALLASGADIHTVNAARREMSRVKAGGLADATAARWLNLVLSDVAGDDPRVVASGPSVHDIDDAVVVGSLADALEAARREAWALRYATTVLSTEVDGEAADEGRRLAGAALALGPDSPPMCLLCGGEPTVTLEGALGAGGRMQEAALAAALAIRDTPIVVACLSTDGTDGPTDAAGAIVDGATIDRGEAAGLDAHAHLARHDSGPWLEATGDRVVTGPTGTNVRDVMLALVPGRPGAVSS